MPGHATDFHAMIFDMDGTLLDTESVFRSIVFDVVAELGFEMNDQVHARMVGSSHEATEKMFYENYGATFPYAFFDEKCRLHMQKRISHTPIPIKRGARELLTAINAIGIPAAVATSSRAGHAREHLGAAGLLDHFETLVTRDDVTHPKPHPEPYLTAAARLNADPRHCLAFEDSYSGVRAAHAAGMTTLMVPDMVAPDADIAALCHSILESLEDAHGRLFAVGTSPAPANELHYKSKT